MDDAAIATLLHLLVFVYWLGGDVGAFLASFVVTDPGQPATARLAAARLLGHIDMAPRSALILALPTGLTLAMTRGWFEIDTPWLAAVWAVSGLWLVLLWHQHIKPAPWIRHADHALRLFLLAGLLAGSWLVEPAFLKAKFALLAVALLAGLAIRRIITPLGPALGALAADHAATADPDIARTLRRARPVVIGIWLTLLAAAWFGIARPT